MTREDFWEWLNAYPGDWDVHSDDFEAIVIGFPIEEDYK
tara:strand:+ start:164 stop:280 length:117 start_codon:yes stop_codon:yes gene_type:complete